VPLPATEGESLGAARADGIADLPAEPEDFVIPGVQIRDAPRFPWRGLLLDPGRHFLSVETVERNLDAMAAVKLNVLHWHLTEDQGFRVESKAFTGLQELGSDGLYYTQDEIREVIAYARDRGIRVMPEFDMPGHTGSWFVGYPGLASAPGPYEIISTWGVHDPAMDPTRETTYELLDTFIGEMAALFPDPYFHIGGDEVNGVQWSANEDIQRFIQDNDLVDNHGLQTYFNRRIQPLLAAHGKTMMGWDEIFQPGLPAGTVVHSWRGPEGVAAAARAGYRTVLSNGYYIDLVESAARHYAVDPLGGPAAELTADERARVLGGEATMWGEYVDDETVDSRIWPRTAAIAERLWSDAAVTEIDDMYRRLTATGAWIEWAGVTHRSYRQPMLKRLAGDGLVTPLATLDEVLEPLKGYRRGGTRKYTRFTPLNRLVDATPPESETARRFARMVDDYLAAEGDASDAATLAALRDQLTDWRDNHELLVPVARGSVMLPEAEALSAQLRVVAELGLAALADLEAEPRTVSEQTEARRAALDEAEQPWGALQIMVVAPVRRLVEAAGKPLW
jgi:hexosaminidase